MANRKTGGLRRLLLKAALRFYPVDFRSNYGDNLLDSSDDQISDIRSQHSFPVAGLLVAYQTFKTAFNIARSGLEERLDRAPESFVPKPSRNSNVKTFLSDLAYSFRTLRKQVTFTVIAILTLALGIGANAAIFSVLNSVVLTPLPYSEPGQLVRAYTASVRRDYDDNYLSAPDVWGMRDKIASLASVGAISNYSEVGKDLMGDAGPFRVRALPVGEGYFTVYRATPLIGRAFERDQNLSMNSVVLSHSLWQSYGGGDEGIIGTSIDLNGEPYEVVGVMRPGFLDVVGGDVDLWIPHDMTPDTRWNAHDNHYLNAVARLAPGVSIETAQAELHAFQQVRRESGIRHYAGEDEYIRLVPLLDDVVGESRSTLAILMGAAAVVLLIACVNVANLFLARGISRSKEMAIRIALGSSRARLFTQLMGESLLVAAAGGVIGSAVSTIGVSALLAVAPESLARAEEISFDPQLVLFALFATVATALFFGTAPAVRAVKADPNDAMRDGTRGNTGGAGARARGILVAGQMALAMLLLVGAGLLMRSFVQLQQKDLGIVPNDIMTFEIHLPVSRYDDPALRIAFHQQLHEKIRAIPGVQSVAAISKLPASGPYNGWGLTYTKPDGERDNFGTQIRIIEGDYFEAFGISMLAGRSANTSDIREGPPVAVINSATARRAFPDRDPLGETVGVGSKWWTVVGVVEDVAHDHLGAIDEKIYLSHIQYGDDRNWRLIQTVKTSASTETLLQQIRDEVATLDGELVVYNARSMEQVLGREVARDKFALLLMGIFAGVALALSAIGLYGVLSYSVNQRFQEIGIRVALGATAGQVRRLMVRQAALLCGAGLLIGLAGSLVASKVLESMLVDVTTRDPMIFGVVGVVLVITAAGAGWVPARRATKVSAMDAMRAE